MPDHYPVPVTIELISTDPALPNETEVQLRCGCEESLWRDWGHA